MKRISLLTKTAILAAGIAYAPQVFAAANIVQQGDVNSALVNDYGSNIVTVTQQGTSNSFDAKTASNSSGQLYTSLPAASPEAQAVFDKYTVSGTQGRENPNEWQISGANRLYVEQVGQNDRVETEVMGTNAVGYIQHGVQDFTSVGVYGDGHQVATIQLGDADVATQQVAGINVTSGIRQEGSNNAANVQAGGNGVGVDLRQYGSTNAATIRGKGDGLTEGLVQAGNNNSASVAELGSSMLGSIQQFGDNNGAVIDQTGGSNYGAVLQSGAGNVLNVNQNGGGLVATIQQLGNANAAVVKQHN